MQEESTTPTPPIEGGEQKQGSTAPAPTDPTGQAPPAESAPPTQGQASRRMPIGAIVAGSTTTVGATGVALYQMFGPWGLASGAALGGAGLVAGKIRRARVNRRFGTGRNGGTTQATRRLAARGAGPLAAGRSAATFGPGRTTGGRPTARGTSTGAGTTGRTSTSGGRTSTTPSTTPRKWGRSGTHGSGGSGTAGGTARRGPLARISAWRNGRAARKAARRAPASAGKSTTPSATASGGSTGTTPAPATPAQRRIATGIARGIRAARTGTRKAWGGLTGAARTARTAVRNAPRGARRALFGLAATALVQRIVTALGWRREREEPLAEVDSDAARKTEAEATADQSATETKPEAEPAAPEPRPAHQTSQATPNGTRTADTGARQMSGTGVIQEVTGALATLARFEPSNMYDLEGLLKSWPEIDAAYMRAKTAMGAKIVEQYPVANELGDLVADNTLLVSQHAAAEEYAGMFRRVAADDFARYEQPQPNEPFRDFTNNA